MNPEVIIPIVGIVSLALVPTCFIFVKHQQKMAEILHGGGTPDHVAALERLTSELGQIRGALTRQALALDALVESHNKLVRALPQAGVNALPADSEHISA